MTLVVAIMCCLGGATLGASKTQTVGPIEIPAWGASEEELRATWPNLKPVMTAEGEDRYWRKQTSEMELLSVPIHSVSVFIAGKQGLQRISFHFSSVADAEEQKARTALGKRLEAALGKPESQGACWAIWKTRTGTVTLELGKVALFAPTAEVYGIDYGCQRLTPLLPYDKKPSPR